VPAVDLIGSARDALRSNELGRAEGLVRQYLESSPASADAWRLLGETLRASGRRGEAVEALRRAVTVAAGDAEARSALGIALAETNRVAEALPHLEEAARLRPAHAPSRHNLGVALAQAGRAAEAVERLREAITLHPDYAEAWYNLAAVLKELGRADESFDALRRAVELRPTYGEALNNLGLALSERGQPDEAIPVLQQAVRLRPNAPEGHNNLGLALAEVGRFSEAEVCYGEALRLDPSYADAHVNLGNALKEQSRTDEALGCYQLALWLKPDLNSARYNRSLTLLQAGRWSEGWAEYEYRWRRGSMPQRHTGRPRWDGSALDGRTILLWCEQGLGDAIQFVRYAALVKDKGGGVVLECPRQLTALLATCPGIDGVVAEGEPLPLFDVQAPLLSLPGLFGTTLESVPAAVPYLAAEPERVATWRSRLESIGGFRIGVCWQGNRFLRGDRHRSFPLACLEPLAAVPGVRLVSLQKGPGADQLKTARFAVADLGEDLDPPPGGFRDTAAVLKWLDLVVSCDSAVAHLAGALGVPVWIALSTMLDWRWLRGRADTPWYPSARLFRQERLGDWSSVFSRMTGELGTLVESRGRAALRIEVSPGDLLDRMVILGIKGRRLSDPSKRQAALAQLAELRPQRDTLGGPHVQELANLEAALQDVNERLWSVEDQLRLCERAGDFGTQFVELARSVYRTNDERSALKRRIDILLGSAIGDQKEYPSYS
jgi:tetratricopeptide (TPR) repeat protein